MTLTELSVFMKKQELELQLRTEKEKEKEEGEFLSCRNTFMYIVSKFKPQGLKSTQENVAVLFKKIFILRLTKKKSIVSPSYSHGVKGRLPAALIPLIEL